MPGRVASICQPQPILTGESRGGDAYALFHAHPELVGIAVCDGDKPIGYVSRTAFLLRMADRFGRALFESRSITHVMDPDPFTVEEESRITALGHRIVREKPIALEQGFVIVRDGRYSGIGSGISLLGALLQQKEAYADGLKELASQREIAEREARQSADAKTAFLAAMSHEIRTPLNGILGLAHALASTELNADQHKLVKTIRSSGNLLNRVLSDVLDLSRIEAAATTLERQLQCPASILDDIQDLWGARAEEKGLAFNTVFHGQTGLGVMIDGDRVRQIVFNLVGNAIKFSQKGQVQVAMSLKDEQGPCSLEIAVSDTGVGIAPDALKRLFQPFAQADTTITRRFGGTGLGLTISSKLAALMGGSIDVVSAPGEGSVFTVRIPVETAALDDASAPDDHEAAHEVDPSSWRILVAEDNPINRTVVTRLLEAVGCTVVTANDGAAALEAATAQPFDIVLMDVQMPVMDGLTATKAIRQSGGPASRLPIVALTANVFAEDRQKCLEAGMDGFVAKPINPTALLNALIDAFAIRSGSDGARIVDTAA